MLLFLNGDWRLDTIMHHCDATRCSCSSEDDARAKIFGALLEAGAVLGSDVGPPSVNRWGTATTAAGQIALFIMCHRVLPQCAEIALRDLSR
ncbi:unnamed protein product, partial [Prorocentrum cordatum]